MPALPAMRWAVSGADSEAVVRRIGLEESLAPHLLDLEVMSALRSMVRRSELTGSQARRAVHNLPLLPIVRIDHRPLLGRCWELRDNLTVYDAAYVALAEVAMATLITADVRMGQAPGVRCEIEVLAL